MNTYEGACRYCGSMINIMANSKKKRTGWQRKAAPAKLAS